MRFNKTEKSTVSAVKSSLLGSVFKVWSECKRAAVSNTNWTETVEKVRLYVDVSAMVNLTVWRDSEVIWRIKDKLSIIYKRPDLTCLGRAYTPLILDGAQT